MDSWQILKHLLEQRLSPHQLFAIGLYPVAKAGPLA
jgi:hypothetical protein